MLVYGRAPAICGVFVPKPDFERMSHIAQTTVKTQMPKNGKYSICNNYGRFIKAEFFVVSAGLIETGLFYCCLRGSVV